MACTECYISNCIKKCNMYTHFTCSTPAMTELLSQLIPLLQSPVTIPPC